MVWVGGGGGADGVGRVATAVGEVGWFDAARSVCEDEEDGDSNDSNAMGEVGAAEEVVGVLVLELEGVGDGACVVASS